MAALKKAGGWISDTLGPILKNFTSWLGDVTGGVEGITSAIQDAITWLRSADTISKALAAGLADAGQPDAVGNRPARHRRCAQNRSQPAG